MDADSARVWLVGASLAITAVIFAFFVLSPVLGFPLTFPQARGLIEIVIPVFLGYLGSASHFVFSHRSHVAPQLHQASSGLVSLMVKGPVVVFTLISVCAIVAFGYSNRIEAPAGSGMTLDALAGLLSGALGFLAVTTSVAVAYLFAAKN